MNLVRFYDPDTKTLSTVPADELAPGCIRCRLEGIEGEVYAQAAKFEPAKDYCHPPFTDPAVLSICRDFAEVFKEVFPMTAEQWADGFRRDAHPEREIAWWANLGGAFNHFTRGKRLPLAAKKDYYALCFAFFNNGAQAALATVALEHLSQARARSVIATLQAGAQP